MEPEKSISEMSKAELLNLRDELAAAKKREEVELSRLNSEYNKFGRGMSQDTYNGTVTMQQDCKTRLAYITESQLELKAALRAIADHEYETKKEGGEKFTNMTLRDYFAAKAMDRFMDEWMEGVRSGRYNQAIEGDLDDDSVHHIIAHDAYTMADAMLKAR